MDITNKVMKSLKILEVVNRKTTDNTIAKETKAQTMIYKTLRRQQTQMTVARLFWKLGKVGLGKTFT